MKKKTTLVSKYYHDKKICKRGILTEREFFVFLHWNLNYSHHEIGVAMFMTEHTSVGDLKKVYRKLGVQSEKTAIVEAIVLRIFIRKDFI